jgi:hypothetical protein
MQAPGFFKAHHCTLYTHQIRRHIV